MKYKTNIFDILKTINNKKYYFYKKMDKDSIKELQPYTLLRWMSSNTIGENSNIIKNSNKINELIFSLSDDKNLCLNLLCTLGNNRFRKYNWIAINKENKTKEDDIIKVFYKLDDESYQLKKKKITKEEIIDILHYLGLKK